MSCNTSKSWERGFSNVCSWCSHCECKCFLLDPLYAVFEFRSRKSLVEHQISGRRPDKITQGISSIQGDVLLICPLRLKPWGFLSSSYKMIQLVNQLCSLWNLLVFNLKTWSRQNYSFHLSFQLNPFSCLSDFRGVWFHSGTSSKICLYWFIL